MASAPVAVTEPAVELLDVMLGILRSRTDEALRLRALPGGTINLVLDTPRLNDSQVRRRISTVLLIESPVPPDLLGLLLDAS